jgi:3-dehydroquinate synthase/shikimate kinase/3-dehydroquinate synthase
MKNTKIIVRTKSKFYPIYFGSGIVDSTSMYLNKNLPNVKKIAIITDKNLPTIILKRLCKNLKNFKIKIYRLPISEKKKNFKVAYGLAENLLKDNFNRSDCVIALGGGILGDISAFVASITKRGLKFINIPTSLLAQVDASIGGKTAVNSIQGKNLIGTFYQPDFVIIDISFLKSLPQREMVCGYAEILKHSLILDRKFFFWLSNNAKQIIENKNNQLLKLAIIKSCKIKSEIVIKDEKEQNSRMVLNFGHTFAHGFEGAINFSKKLNHGEAVLLGMMIACQLSYKNKILPFKDLSLIEKHYLNLKLPRQMNNFFKKNQINKIIFFMKKDKKNLDKKINLVLIKKIGQVSKPIVMKANSVKKFLHSYYKK